MNLLKALATVSSMTLVSRVLGLVRDVLIARVFGAGLATDAFFVAFRIPNLLRRLFAEVAPEIGDPDLRGRLEAASGEEDGSLRISDLNRSNDGLRTLLIELHAHVEEIDTEAARRIEAAIWQELRVSTERRALSLAPF